MGNGRLGGHVPGCSTHLQLFFSFRPSTPLPSPTRKTGWLWAHFFSFLLLGSQLSARIRKEADEAISRRREIERLYKFSQKLLGEGNVLQLMNAIPDYIVESFEAGAAELFLPQKTNFIAPVSARRTWMKKA